MTNKTILAAAVAAAIGVGGVAITARADSMFSLMNPFEWFFGDDDWGDRHYRHGPYGRGGPYGGPYTWNGPYGYGYPAYRTNPTVIVLPSEGASQTAAIHPE